MLSKDDPRNDFPASDTEKAAAAVRHAVVSLDAIERELSAAEQQLWQLHWSKDDPLVERLRRVGVSDATAEMVVDLVRGWEALCCGKPMPAETNAILDRLERGERTARCVRPAGLNSDIDATH